MANITWRNRLGAGRGGLSVAAYAFSLAATFWTAGGWATPIVIVIAACAWNVFLFWPEIKSVRIVVPKGGTAQPVGWLYIFAFVGVGALILDASAIYLRYSHAPRALTSDEFAEPYINAKYFHLADLADANNFIAGRTFENDWIYGPAVVALGNGSDIQGSKFLGDFDQVFQPVQPEQQVGAGVIVISDGKFRNCHFVNVTFVATPELIARFRGSNYGPGTSNPDAKQ